MFPLAHIVPLDIRKLFSSGSVLQLVQDRVAQASVKFILINIMQFGNAFKFELKPIAFKADLCLKVKMLEVSDI